MGPARNLCYSSIKVVTDDWIVPPDSLVSIRYVVTAGEQICRVRRK